MKKNNKGFTLVELIVVLVILAILAAILVPALLGWIDKAREKSVTNNAEAALVATQGLVTERYGKYEKPTGITFADINKLADIDDSGAAISYKLQTPFNSAAPSKTMYKLSSFTYTAGKNGNGKTATWNPSTGAWTVK